MAESLNGWNKIHQDVLQERIVPIRTIEESETESYEIVKDKETGEHYLRYYYMHLNIADGSREHYNQLLPLDSDDVIGIMFGEQPYRYPEHWRKKFLRNGPEGYYVWFDPGEDPDRTEDEAYGRWLAERLSSFKRDGRFDPESVQKLLDEIERRGRQD
ncbi:hypothetical protein ACFQWB_13695 [Paenibacillus thermoaerophilus]|jgi:hypothetical protein|uniref:Uncharacterized protein n=1 Tax=Paenibacillus thermoaerophilus TaxID=1215385 RepID=A0ABW2V488_9BACL|nr:hypothetical protein [Paenibacillus thermoaerophilus]TMV16124.1 hypothetical protein FE781_08625 [Paenibacillus thermoaerophilus]